MNSSAPDPDVRAFEPISASSLDAVSGGSWFDTATKYVGGAIGGAVGAVAGTVGGALAGTAADGPVAGAYAGIAGGGAGGTVGGMAGAAAGEAAGKWLEDLATPIKDQLRARVTKQIRHGR